jgi:hypothetical protein
LVINPQKIFQTLREDKAHRLKFPVRAANAEFFVAANIVSNQNTIIYQSRVVLQQFFAQKKWLLKYKQPLIKIECTRHDSNMRPHDS